MNSTLLFYQYLTWTKCPHQPRNRVPWTRFLCMKTEFNELDSYKLKSTPLDLISNSLCSRSHSKTQTVSLKTQNFQNKQSLSFPPTLSLSHSLTLTHSRTLSLLIPPHSVSPSRSVSPSGSVAVPLAPSPSLYQFHSVLPFRSVVVALPLRRRPKNGLLAMISIPTTAGYHSHLISSMWFLGVYIIVWMIVWIVFVF